MIGQPRGNWHLGIVYTMKTAAGKILVVWLGMITLSLSLHAQGFVLSSSPGVGGNPSSVAAADFNGDGKLDLVSANTTANTISIFTNNGSGFFVSNISYATFIGPQAVIATDVNRDGAMDLVCASSKLIIFTNTGSGGFVTAGNYTIGGSRWVVAADVNGDGKVDLICPGSGLPLMVLTNTDNGLFAAAPAPPGAGTSWFAVAVDVNGDGKVDLIDVDIGGGGSFSYMRVLTNNGEGMFMLSSTNALTTRWPGSITSADVNGDGKSDIIIPDYDSGSGNTLLLLTNNGYGDFGSNATYFVGTGPYFVVAADVNGDSKADLITANLFSTLNVLTNKGSGGFGSNATLNVGANPRSIVAADVNGDGRLDLISANNGSSTLSVLTNALTFLPNLNIRNSINGAIISWPPQWSGWAGWTLQQNIDLNISNWTAFSGTIGDDGTAKTATNSSTFGTSFFRLIHP